MSKFRTSGVRAFSSAQFLTANALAANALYIVEDRFGSGYPNYHGGEHGGLAYHNHHHSWVVQKGVERMVDALGLSATERVIGGMAAAAHDIVQHKPRGVMERESADWLAAAMRRSNVFPESAIKMGVSAILGTEPIFENNRIVGQIASTQEYPSRIAELIGKTVGCADLGELYASTGPLVAHDFYKEVQGIGQTQTPPMDKLSDFQLGQVLLAETYR